MKFSRSVLFVIFSLFATSVFAQTQMPDYSKWNKTDEHSNSYILNGKNVQVRDIHYEFASEKEQSFLFIFYSPNTSKTWFSVYVREYSDKPLVAYLYESDKDGKWVFVEDVTKGDMKSVLKKYGLIEVVK